MIELQRYTKISCDDELVLFSYLLYWEGTSDQSVQVVKSSQPQLVGFLVDPSSLISQLSVPDYKSN